MHNLIHHTRPDGSEHPMHECKIYESFRHGKETHVDNGVQLVRRVHSWKTPSV